MIVLKYRDAGEVISNDLTVRETASLSSSIQPNES